MKLTIDKDDGTKQVVALMWKGSPESTPPTPPASYDEDYTDKPDEKWYKHPILARSGYSFVSASVDGGNFSTPATVDVSLDP